MFGLNKRKKLNTTIEAIKEDDLDKILHGCKSGSLGDISESQMNSSVRSDSDKDEIKKTPKLLLDEYHTLGPSPYATKIIKTVKEKQKMSTNNFLTIIILDNK
nr:hypothetical protein [uncultured Butyrivibrio sp.]